MSRPLEATPDQVLAILGGVAGGVLAAIVGFAAWHLSGGPRAKRVAASIARHPAGKAVGR